MTRTIILEGMDNSGKTTLALELSRLLNMPLLHSASKLRGEPLMRWANAYIRFEGILDRHPWISEPIYGDTLPNRRSIIKREVAYDDLIKSGVPIIYCRPARQGYDPNRREMPGVGSEFAKLADAYDDYFIHYTGKYYIYDYQADPDRVRLIHDLKTLGWIEVPQ